METVTLGGTGREIGDSDTERHREIGRWTKLHWMVHGDR